MMAKKPYQDSRLAKFLKERLMELKHTKTQAEIAEDAGFVNPNTQTMIKNGASKPPVDHVPGLGSGTGL
jgi:hypothetical protein